MSPDPKVLKCHPSSLLTHHRWRESLWCFPTSYPPETLVSACLLSLFIFTIFSNLSPVWDPIWQLWQGKMRRKRNQSVMKCWEKEWLQNQVLATWPEPLSEPQGRSSTRWELSRAHEAKLTAGANLPHFPWKQEIKSLHERQLTGASMVGDHTKCQTGSSRYAFRAEKIEAYFTNASLLFLWLEVSTKCDSADKWFLLLPKLQCWASLQELFCQL